MREWLEYAAAWTALRGLGALPRGLARATGVAVARLAWWLRPPLRRAAEFNLRLAFPNWGTAERRRVTRAMVRNIGWMAGEFAQFPRYTRERVEEFVLLDGYENYAAAAAAGRGVLVLTGHIGAWELAPFAQALFGAPLHFLVRPIPNRRVDALVMRYRCFSGNRPIAKSGAARAIIRVLRQGGAVGILLDLNAAADDGVFVPFFGIPAATSDGMARIALRTGAPVVPGYVFWDAGMRKYRLRFEPAVELVRTGEEEADVRENTARFTKVIEAFARQRPDQWLWVHKRWKTRPPGEPPLYPF
jgi:Kdo2-lipid IVA lauroyltransferase/acyltransferase